MSGRSDQRWDIDHALEALDRLADWSDRPQADRAAAQTLASTVRVALRNAASAVDTGWRRNDELRAELQAAQQAAVAPATEEPNQ